MCSKSSALLVISLTILLAALFIKDANAATIRNILTTVTPTLNQTTTGNTTAQPTTPEVCEDENNSCAWWRKFGYCYNGYINGYMRKVCKKTCGFCGHMSGKCRDKFFYCPSWTSYGGSKAFACKLSFYQKRCPYTCRACKQ